MSEMSKKARSAMRAKANRMAGTDTENGKNDPHKKVDASSWVPNESLNTTRKTGARPIRSRIYKAGGRIQGDRAMHAGKMPRGGKASGGPLTVYNTVKDNEDKLGKYHEGGYKKGGHAKRHKRDMGGMADPRATADQTIAAGAARAGVAPNRMQFTGTGKPFGSLRKGGRAEAKVKAERYCAGGMAEGGRSKRAEGGKAEKYWTYKPSEETPSLAHALEAKAIHPDTTESDWAKMSPGMRREVVRSAKKRPERAHGGRAKGKTNINIIIGAGHKDQPQMPPQGVVRPPMPPPPPPQMGPPPGGPPPGLGGAGGPPPGIPPGGPPPMMRKQGGMVKMHAGAGSGLGRLEKAKIQARVR